MSILTDSHLGSTQINTIYRGSALLKGGVQSVSTIPDQDYTVDTTITPLDVSSYFTGSSLTYEVSSGDDPLPNGLTLSGSEISGTPSQEGTSNITIRAFNLNGSATQSFQIVVQGAFQILTVPGEGGEFYLSFEQPDELEEIDLVITSPSHLAGTHPIALNAASITLIRDLDISGNDDDSEVITALPALAVSPFEGIDGTIEWFDDVDDPIVGETGVTYTQPTGGAGTGVRHSVTDNTNTINEEVLLTPSAGYTEQLAAFTGVSGPNYLRNTGNDLVSALVDEVFFFYSAFQRGEANQRILHLTSQAGSRFASINPSNFILSVTELDSGGSFNQFLEPTGRAALNGGSARRVSYAGKIYKDGSNWRSIIRSVLGSETAWTTDTDSTEAHNNGSLLINNGLLGSNLGWSIGKRHNGSNDFSLLADVARLCLIAGSPDTTPDILSSTDLDKFLDASTNVTVDPSTSRTEWSSEIVLDYTGIQLVNNNGITPASHNDVNLPLLAA